MRDHLEQLRCAVDVLLENEDGYSIDQAQNLFCMVGNDLVEVLHQYEIREGLVVLESTDSKDSVTVTGRKITKQCAGTSEKSIMARGMVRESQKGNIVWRNNTGALELADGRWMKVGLCNGSSDVIGIEPVTIKREHVGQLFGRFIAIEYKTKTGRVSPEQQRFIDAVNAAGGRAWVDRGEEDES